MAATTPQRQMNIRPYAPRATKRRRDSDGNCAENAGIEDTPSKRRSKRLRSRRGVPFIPYDIANIIFSLLLTRTIVLRNGSSAPIQKVLRVSPVGLGFERSLERQIMVPLGMVEKLKSSGKYSITTRKRRRKWFNQDAR